MLLRVTYLELTQHPAPIPSRAGDERVSSERLDVTTYLNLYKRVGEPLGWDQRLKMLPGELADLLACSRIQLYVLRDGTGQALGFCEFDRSACPDIELKNFGLIPSAQGRGLGPWFLSSALHNEWQSGPTRIWLHTDVWDHPAAIRTYERAGFRVYRVQEEPPENL